MLHASRDDHLRIAAVGDLHVSAFRRAPYRQLFQEIGGKADVLVLSGDLTSTGTLAEGEILAEDLSACPIPVIGVLGNHDHHAGKAYELAKLLRRAGMHLLDGSGCLIYGVGFAGCKGAMGGFGRQRLCAYGEDDVKQFVAAARGENVKLQRALVDLDAPRTVVVTHYAPVRATLLGEPPEIFAFLGSDLLGETIDRFPRVSCAFHGHAHGGSHLGRTPGGVPVYNVAQPLLRRALGQNYVVTEV